MACILRQGRPSGNEWVGAAGRSAARRAPRPNVPARCHPRGPARCHPRPSRRDAARRGVSNQGASAGTAVRTIPTQPPAPAAEPAAERRRRILTVVAWTSRTSPSRAVDAEVVQSIDAELVQSIRVRTSRLRQCDRAARAVTMPSCGTCAGHHVPSATPAPGWGRAGGPTAAASNTSRCGASRGPAPGPAPAQPSPAQRHAPAPAQRQQQSMIPPSANHPTREHPEQR